MSQQSVLITSIPKTVVIMALNSEAPALYRSSLVKFSGVGKVNAAICATQLITEQKPDLIINLGTAGGIFVDSGLHEVGSFVQRDIACTALGFDTGVTPFDSAPAELSFGRSGLRCGTGDNFVAGVMPAVDCDLVDMEAYAIAKVCWKYGIDFRCWKWVSDSADHSAADDWTQSVHTGQQYYIDKLKELGYDI